ncbi:hypothetical protein KI387_026194, partial [Taxus chinensis]
NSATMGRQRIIILVVILGVLFLTVGSNGACSQGSCQAHDICAKDSDCAVGLKCISCSSVGDMSYRCTRISVTNPVSKVGGLPFNRYSWLTTHNSFAILGEKSYTGTNRITFSNQEDSVTNQLNNGVRGLMLDMYDFENDIWLCHSFGGNCLNFTAFMPAINTLQEITAFLAANPSEIITIIIEDYVKAPKGLTKVFTAAGLMKYWFPVSRMPQNGEDWPTVNDMVAKNQRLIVFTSQRSKEASEGIAYEWKYVVENQYGDAGLLNGSCTNRAESKSLTSKSQSLFLENFFPTNPSQPVACTVNSDQLSNILSVCYKNAGERWANFLAVDFYKRSYGGGAFQAVDELNGKLTCGCSDITECQANGTFGVCRTSNTKVSPTGGASTQPAADASAAPCVQCFIPFTMLLFLLHLMHLACTI